MTEESLKDLHIDTLFDLMIKCTEELSEARVKYGDNGTETEHKKEEVKLLQRVVVAKTAEFLPG